MMNCEKFERTWEAEDDPSHLSPALEEHRRACPACAALVADLNLIRRQARQLLLTEPPSDAVWERIQERLEHSGLIRKPAAKPREAIGLSWFGWLPRFPMGVAYATVFVLAFGIVYLRGILNNNVPALPVASAPPAATAALSPELLSQPLPREEEVQQLLEKIPPEIRSVYSASWHRVNSSIEQLQQDMRMHPGDSLTQRQLFTAYQQREWLWGTMVRKTGEEF